MHASLAIFTAHTHGSASVAGDVVTYIPADGYYGVDSISYTATGPGGTSAPATLSITIGLPAAPGVSDTNVSVGYNNAKAIDLSAFVTGVHTTLNVTTTPSKGSVSLSGTIATYTPNDGAIGNDSFAYTATGPGGTSAPATVTLAIDMPPPPTSTGTSTSVEGAASTGNSTELPAGSQAIIDLSSLVSGTYTSIELVTAPQHGRVELVGSATPQAQARSIHASAVRRGISAVYTPNAGYYGPDSFQFAAVGPGGPSPAATVAITVTGSVPVAQSSRMMRAKDGQPVFIDLTEGAVGGPFTAANIVSITPADQASAVIVTGGAPPLPRPIA